MTKKKLTLEEKQAIGLKRQQEREKNKVNQDESKFYCTNKDLLGELLKWKNSAENPEDRIMSEELGKMILRIVTKLTNHSKFRNYSYDLKQEMISYGSFKIVQGLKNYNFAYKNPFAYITQAAYNAFINVLTKHYKQINLRKELIRRQLVQLECSKDINSSKIINDFIRDYLGISGEEE